MAQVKELEMMLDESTNDILDHLDLMSADRLCELMDRISFELMDRNMEGRLEFNMNEADLDVPF
jgi:hypothetical protein